MLNDISRHTFYMSQLVRLEGKHATQNAHCEMLGYICKPCCHSIKFNECLSNIHCHLIRINILTFQSIEPLPLKADFGSNDRKTGQLKMNERLEFTLSMSLIMTFLSRLLMRGRYQSIGCNRNLC